MEGAAHPAQGSGLLSLPAELRWKIWDAVAVEEDLSDLASCSRLMRQDMLSRIPGASYSCACSPVRACQCGKSVPIDQLTIIVEPDCSERRWLRFRIIPANRGPNRATAQVWSVAHLDSRFARVIRYYRPREVVIEFQQPSVCEEHLLAPMLVLRAKLFDLIQVLEWYQPLCKQYLQIRLAGTWSRLYSWIPHRWPVRQSFWDHKFDLSYFYYKERCAADRRLKYLYHIIRIRRIQYFLCRPPFYQALLSPLCLHWAWRNAEIIFDLEPELGPGLEYVHDYTHSHEYHGSYPILGFDSLRLAHWAYMNRLIGDGALRGRPYGQTSPGPYFDQQDINAETWAQLKPRKRRRHQQDLYFHLVYMIGLSEYFDQYLLAASDHSGKLIEPLRAHILRTRNLSPANAFSKSHPKVEAEGWQWNLDIIRQAYVRWALGKSGRCKVWENHSVWKAWWKNYEFVWPDRWPQTYEPFRLSPADGEWPSGEYRRKEWGGGGKSSPAKRKSQKT